MPSSMKNEYGEYINEYDYLLDDDDYFARLRQEQESDGSDDSDDFDDDDFDDMPF